MIVPSPAGMQAAAFNIGRLAGCMFMLLAALAWPALVGCPLHTSARLWHTNSDSYGSLESGVERGTVSECLTLRIV